MAIHEARPPLLGFPGSELVHRIRGRWKASVTNEPASGVEKQPSREPYTNVGTYRPVIPAAHKTTLEIGRLQPSRLEASLTGFASDLAESPT